MLEKIVKNINGSDYEFWITPVQKIAIEIKAIQSQDYSYRIKQHNANNIEIEADFINAKFHPVRSLGRLHYNIEKDVVTYRKNIKSKHEYLATNAIGLAWDIIKNLRPKDIIKIYIENSILTIPVHSVLKHKEFKHYKRNGYELQCFIPIEHFKEIKSINKF